MSRHAGHRGWRWVRPLGDAALGAVLLLAACRTPATPVKPDGADKPLRLALCSERPLRLPAALDDVQSRGCVVTFRQEWSDPASIAWLGARQAVRRYLVYAPVHLPAGPVPLVLVFPGSSASAE